MSSNLERYRADLESLITLGEDMFLDLCPEVQKGQVKQTKEEKTLAEKVKGTFSREYQRWYTEASAVIRQLIPDRLPEFVYCPA